ncbi:FAD-dependent oxidoreductase [Caulobacter segnis]|uniref:D-amino-acid oxidase n=1 Tax=Caulobacter segnis TaxID=88688 RepID=A0A2W5V1F0_9CAUL|nr:MAG: hypothetical protein DI526_12895 [Caulobacter segnis]
MHPLPGADTVVVGGTTQKGDWDTKVRQSDTDLILSRAYAAVPSLRRAEIVKVWAGLRPGRSSVRLEVERIRIRGREIPVVHNYGHGGSGLTIGYGTAGDAVEIAACTLNL